MPEPDSPSERPDFHPPSTPGTPPAGQPAQPPAGPPPAAPGPGSPPPGHPAPAPSGFAPGSGYPPPGFGYPPGPPPAGPPPSGYGWQPGRAPQQGRGSIWLGIGITLVTLLGLFGLTTTLQPGSAVADAVGMAAVVAPLALIVVGIVLAVVPRTTRTGAGILIGIGAGILIAGGLCVALLVSYGG